MRGGGDGAVSQPQWSEKEVVPEKMATTNQRNLNPKNLVQNATAELSIEYWIQPMQTLEFTLMPLAVEDGGIPIENLREVLRDESQCLKFAEALAEALVNSNPDAFWPGKRVGYAIMGCIPPGLRQDQPVRLP